MGSCAAKETIGVIGTTIAMANSVGRESLKSQATAMSSASSGGAHAFSLNGLTGGKDPNKYKVAKETLA